jgi:RNA polymerase sigma-70 factor (ECF subfamily)
MDGSSMIVEAAPQASLRNARSTDSERRRRFEQVITLHLDSAYNLARWMVHDDSDAEDIVQEACLRAYKYLDGLEGNDATGWFLAIVRNAAFTWMRRKRRLDVRRGGDGVDQAVPERQALTVGRTSQALNKDPETLLVEHRERIQLNELIQQLPAEQREMVVLRDIEDFSYREISAITGIPIGTVMSRLCRARRLLRERYARSGFGDLSCVHDDRVRHAAFVSARR